MRVCLGGTFHPFHAGHRGLLEAALDAEALFIGITDGDLARRGRPMAPWQQRAEGVRRYLASKGFSGSLTIRPLTHAMGPAATDAFDRIVVSPETEAGAEAINEVRRRAGLPALDVRVVPHVLAQDLLPISGTRIHAGDIDEAGIRSVPVRLSVGSANPVKVEGAREALEQILDCPVEARGHAVASGVGEQPVGQDTMRGARQRASEAMAAWPEADYAVGIEAGLVEMPGDGWMDVQACALHGRDGTMTTGWGPAFAYPAWVTRRALAGEMVSEILGPVAHDPRIGGTTGAIGFLTDGRMDRTRLTGIALLMACTPRIRRALYTSAPQ